MIKNGLPATVLWLGILSATAPVEARDGDGVEQQLESHGAQIEMLKRQVEDLMRASSPQGRTVPRTTARSGSPAPAPTQAQAKAKAPLTISSGQKNVKLTLSGHVSRAMLFYDDGKKSEFRSVDNKNSSTRLRFVAAAKLTPTLSLGAKLEVGIESNSSGSVSQRDFQTVEGGGSSTVRDRYQDITLTSKIWGKLYLGKGDTASNKTSEVDLSGTAVAGSGDIDDTGGGLFFARADGSLSDIRSKAALNHMDGLSRGQRIRYDTPAMSGLIASVSRLDGGAFDLALRFGQKFGPLSVKAAAAYADTSSTSNTRNGQFNGSISVLHNNGVNLTVSGGQRNTTGAARARDPWFIYVKVGYRARLNKLGRTSFAADYGTFEELRAVDETGQVWGLQAVQALKAWNSELFVSWRHLDLDTPAEKVADIDLVLAGARLKF